MVMEWQPERLISAREALGISQGELARRLGVTQPAVSAWESGKNSPRGNLLVSLARLLGKPPGYFFGSEPVSGDAAAVAQTANGSTGLGDRLRRAREALGLGQEEAAAQVGVSRSALNMYERGERDPDTAILASLARLYGVSTDWLLGLVGDEARELPPQARDPRAIHLAAKRTYEREFREMKERHEREFQAILRRMREDFEAGKPSETGLLKD